MLNDINKDYKTNTEITKSLLVTVFFKKIFTGVYIYNIKNNKNISITSDII